MAEVLCDSVNVIHPNTGAGVPDLRLIPCRLEAGHLGDCRGAHGQVWTRLDNLLRARGLELVGHLVRPLAPTDVCSACGIDVGGYLGSVPECTVLTEHAIGASRG